jgi:hypothetical protein
MKSPEQTILVVGNRNTGKTTLIYRNMGIFFSTPTLSQTQTLIPDPAQSGMDIYMIPRLDGTYIRVIELNHGFPAADTASGIARVPDEYRDLISKVIVVASFENEYSIHDIPYHISCYEYFQVPIHIVMNKKDLRTRENIRFLAGLLGDDESKIHIVSCKYDANFLNICDL